MLAACWPESVQCRCTGGALPLHLACKSSSRRSNKNLLPVIQSLLEAWPDSVRELDDQGFLPLHYACNNNGAEDDVIQYLVRAWPDACHIPVKSHGILPLHFALRSSTTRSLETIRLLLEAGPDAVRKPDSRGLLPLHYACERGGTHDVIQFLIEQWPLSLSTKTKDGNLPLHFALLNNKKLSLETIQLLVQACPVAVREYDHKGRLPLHLALFEKGGGDCTDDVIQCLVYAWPESCQVLTKDDELALHLACGGHRSSAVILFILDCYPPAVRWKDKKSLLPLHTAGMRETALESMVIERLVRAYPESILIPCPYT